MSVNTSMSIEDSERYLDEADAGNRLVSSSSALSCFFINIKD